MPNRSQRLPRPEPPPEKAAAGMSAPAGGESKAIRNHKQQEIRRWARRRQGPGEVSIYLGLTCVGTIMATGGRFRAAGADDREIDVYGRFKDAADAVLRHVLPSR